jgi:hypothetical protein
MPAMKKPAPFLWFNDNAEEAIDLYLRILPPARKLDELRVPCNIGELISHPKALQATIGNDQDGPAHTGSRRTRELRAFASNSLSERKLEHF